jgi:hypothetical protein
MVEGFLMKKINAKDMSFVSGGTRPRYVHRLYNFGKDVALATGITFGINQIYIERHNDQEHLIRTSIKAPYLPIVGTIAAYSGLKNIVGYFMYDIKS